jgi:carbon storage regulator
MLILTRRVGEALVIGDDVKVTILSEFKGDVKASVYNKKSCSTGVDHCEIGDFFIVNDDVVINFLSVKGNQVKVGIDAPKSISVHREEIYKKILAERSAA